VYQFRSLNKYKLIYIPHFMIYLSIVQFTAITVKADIHKVLENVVEIL
jgi:hypothetical protein